MKITWRSLVMLFVIIFTLFVLSRFYTFQTFMGRVAAHYFSGKLNTEITLDRIQVSGLFSINMNGLRVLDRHERTLVEAREIGIGFDVRTLFKSVYEFL